MPIATVLPEAKPGVIHRRCSCARCGVHVMGAVGKATLGGRCANCGSYELVPLTRRRPPGTRTG